MDRFRAAGQLERPRIETLTVNVNLLPERSSLELSRQLFGLQWSQSTGHNVAAILKCHLTRCDRSKFVCRWIDSMADNYRAYQVALFFRAIVERLQHHLIQPRAA